MLAEPNSEKLIGDGYDYTSVWNFDAIIWKLIIFVAILNSINNRKELEVSLVVRRSYYDAYFSSNI